MRLLPMFAEVFEHFIRKRSTVWLMLSDLTHRWMTTGTLHHRVIPRLEDSLTGTAEYSHHLKGEQCKRAVPSSLNIEETVGRK